MVFWLFSPALVLMVSTGGSMMVLPYSVTVICIVYCRQTT